MPKNHGKERKGPKGILPTFVFPSAADLAAAEGTAKELQELAVLRERLGGPPRLGDLPLPILENYSNIPLHKRKTYLLPQRLAHHQVRFLAPHLDFKSIMNAVPTEPGLSNSIDPFADPLDNTGYPNFAVLKIGNIPYGATKQEILHFLGRDAQGTLTDQEGWGPSIHIIMERSTSKTMDCYVEMKTRDAVLEQFQRYWETITGGSNRPPRIGHRMITVEVSSQDQLMKDMFPRAKCVRWENGAPIIMENDDPYSTGFTGYFTNEEMVGLVRHAEHPQRSPFSMKCLQRTYECMISTLWKFPWHARDTYSVRDRNNLFITYMKLLDVLVYKVDHTTSVSLSQQLLLDYVFAGLNCKGFGERQRGLLYVRGGRVAAPINVPPIHSYWPFDLVSKRLGQQDSEFCKVYLNLIEQGVQAVGPSELMPKFFIHAEGRLPGADQPEIRNTFFEFNERSQGLTFAAATEIELQLMAKLLKAGYRKVNGVYPGTYEESQRQERLAEEQERYENQKIIDAQMAANMERLKMQRAELKKDNQKEEPKDDSPPQSPKGSLAPRDTDLINADNTPVEPRRRLSEPQPYTGTLGAGLDISPMRTTSGSRAIPTKDPRTKLHSTPTKASKRMSFTARDTIQEESETDDA